MKKIFIVLFSLFIISCDKEKVDGEVILTCVIDSVWVKKPKSTIEYEIVFYYKTDCGNTLTTRRHMTYQKGDTIFYKVKIKK